MNKRKRILTVALTALVGSSCLASGINLSLREKIQIGYINAIFSTVKCVGKAAWNPYVQVAAGALGLTGLIAAQIYDIKKKSEPAPVKQPLTYEQAAKVWAMEVGAMVSAVGLGLFTLHSLMTWIQHA